MTDIPVRFTTGPHKGRIVMQECVCAETSTRNCPVHGKDVVCPECGESVHAHRDDCKQGKLVQEGC